MALAVLPQLLRAESGMLAIARARSCYGFQCAHRENPPLAFLQLSSVRGLWRSNFFIELVIRLEINMRHVRRALSIMIKNAKALTTTRKMKKTPLLMACVWHG